MKYIFSILIVFTFMSNSLAQAGGMRVYAGTSSVVNKDIIANPEGFSHSGYHIGADGRLMSGGMSFLVGVRYTSVSQFAVEDFKLFGHESSLAIMNGRVGLDISIYSFTNFLRIRTKALGSFDIVLTQSGPGMPPPGYILNDGWFGLITGLGVDIGPATIDLEYKLGLVNGYNKKKKSTFDSLSLSVGFFF